MFSGTSTTKKKNNKSQIMQKKAIFLVVLLLCVSSLFAQLRDVTMTVLYDNYVVNKKTKAEWGFACLVEGAEKTILFDTGTTPDILWHNIKELKVDVNAIDIIVLSHNHGDHTGGLFSVLEKNPDVTVYLLSSFTSDFRNKIGKAGADVVVVEEPVEICKDVYTTGKMGTRIREQSMILDTEKGLVIITGCSHQGIVNIIERSKEVREGRDLYLVFGGFHLMDRTPGQVDDIITEFKKNGVKHCGASHCTGKNAIEAFKEAYGKDFIKIGTGKVIEI